MMQIAKGFVVVCVGAIFLAGCGGDADGSDSGGGGDDSGGGPCKLGGGCQAKECAAVVKRFTDVDGKCGSGAANNASCTCSEFTALNTTLVGLTDCGATSQGIVDALKESVANLASSCGPCFTAATQISQKYMSCGVGVEPQPDCICPVIKDGLEQIDELDAMGGCTPEGRSQLISWNETISSANSLYCTGRECAAAVHRFSEIRVKCDQGGPNENSTCICSEYEEMNTTLVGLTDCGPPWKVLVDDIRDVLALVLPSCDPCWIAGTEIQQSYTDCGDPKPLACICSVIDHGFAQIDALGDCSSPEGQALISLWKDGLLLENNTLNCSGDASSTLLLV